MSHGKIAVRLRVSGIVQGVGFRPFIHRIARKSNVKGYVRNLGGSEVEIHVEGTLDNVLLFLHRLEKEKPPPAIIEELELERTKTQNFKDFKILKSSFESKLYSMIPPDIGICKYCLEEILDPKSRWYMYPFNSCAWCGPRFSIMEKVPYDREYTSMIDFPLCNECLKEYRDPENTRRFHAQGISCPKCGPKVWLTDNRGEPIPSKNPIFEAAKLIDEGCIIAIKGIGGFHIASLATDDDVVLTLRKRKRRPQKPFALMALNVEVVEKIAEPSKRIIEALLSPEKPIVLVPKKKNTPVSEYVAPGLDTLGIMLPYTGLHYMLLSWSHDKFLIMTSGNPKGKPMCIDEKCAFEKLSKYVDYFLLHNRRIINRVDDSVVRLTHGKLTFLRRSRGYAPKWFKSPIELDKPIIAFGAELANAGAIGIKNYIIPTQYIGDMDDYETLCFLEEALMFLAKTYHIDLRKAIYVSDMHPQYATTRLAREWSEKYSSKIIAIQHHHAHIASVMVEQKIPYYKWVVGIAIDGVGYGLDGNIWGGEVLLASYSSFKRVGHLVYQPMPGGDLATLYPVRMLISYMMQTFGEDYTRKYIIRNGLHKWLKYGLKELDIVIRQVNSGLSPMTSSTGRFLDTISALLGICYLRTYEGEPAMKLEAYAKRNKGKVLDYQPKITVENGVFLIDVVDMFRWVFDNLESKRKEDIASTIQYNVGEALAEVALKAMKGRKILPKILVSGGAAVNDFIIKAIVERAREEDIEVVFNTKVPPGDGGLALGQVAIAASQIGKHT